jgi:VWFA-related protein
MWHSAARDPIRRKRFLVYTFLATFGCLTISIWVLAQASDQVVAPSTGNQTPYHLKVTSNLVVVRVVVRDAQNKPIENLQKEDFKLFDRGKPQSITQFAVEMPSSQATGPALAVTSGHPSITLAPASALPQRFLALYFDDLNMSDSVVIQAREAVDRYLAANLQPNDRVGLFTSGNSLSDFTDDPKQIHDALLKLRVSPVALRNHDCPDISDYQAQQIIEFDDEKIDAWRVAIDQALNDQRCSQVPRPPVPGEPQRYIAVLARRILEQSQLQSRANLQELEKVVNYVSRMPGQRTVVLVSPGFLSRSEQFDLDQIIDHALRAQVVISSLDPRGMANLMREGDASQGYMPVGSERHRLDSERESAARDVLQEAAQGTGGEFLQNTNDLQTAFARLAGSPAYYLGFAPTDMKLDGKFHDLKVELAEKHAGFSIQARRGYFAPRSEAEAAASAEQGAPIDAEAQTKEQIREAIYSRTDLQQLPVTMDVKVFSTKTEDRELVLSGRLDTNALHLRKDGQRNLNSVTFVSAIFDQKDNLVQLQRGQAKLEAPDAQLQQVLNTGLKMDSTFELKPGIYRVREVVTDSEDHHITALSRNVNVSAECCATREVAGIQPIPAPQPSVPHEPAGHPPSPPGHEDIQPASANPPAYFDYPLRKLSEVVPALSGIKSDSSQDQLSWILSKVGEATVHSLATVPNLVSLEDVFSLVVSRDTAPANSVLGIEEIPAVRDLEEQLRQSRSVEFNYLLLFDHHPDGATAIQELRTDFKNREVASPADGVAPHGFGFAYQWLLLSPANQSELRFRYLGTQRMAAHQTFVVAFAQIPSRVKVPGKYKLAGKEVPFFFQGIAWIDQSTFDVVRLRTDLLSPVPSVNLQNMTTELSFRSVRIHGFGTVLWLPSEVLIRTARSDSIFEEIHQYSRYKFFHAESKLLPNG